MRSGGKTLFKKKNKQVSHALVSQKKKKNIHKKKKERKREERKEKILKQKQGPIKFPNIRSVFIYSACLYVAGTF